MTRRSFFVFFKWLILFFLGWLLWDLIREEKRISPRKSTVKIPAEIPLGVSFFGGVVAVRDKNGIRFFLSRCTHMGCMITKTENGNLVCPCHGSRFDIHGNAVKGPATVPLKSLEASLDRQSGEWKIEYEI